MTAGGHRQSHRLLLLPRVLRQRRQIKVGQQREVVVDRRIANLLELGVHRKRILIEAHHIAEALAHLLNAIQPHQDRQQQAELGSLVEVALQVAAHGHIELLIGSPQLHIGVHSHRVVSLQQGIEEFMQGNRGPAAVALGEVVLGQHLAHGAGAEQADHRRQVHALQPLGVVANLQPTRGLEIQQRRVLWLVLPQLTQIGGGVGGHLFFGQLHPGGALAGGVADAGGEIANDQHRRMARILKGPQFAEQNAVPQVNVAAGGVDAKLHPQRTLLPFSLSKPCHQCLIGIGWVPCREQVGHATRQPARQGRG